MTLTGHIQVKARLALDVEDEDCTCLSLFFLLLCYLSLGYNSTHICKGNQSTVCAIVNFFSEETECKKSGGGGGALIPHFGRHVPRQSEKCRAPKQSRE